MSDGDDRLAKYLADAHSIEVQAISQLNAAPQLAGDARIATILADHLAETHEHERRIRELLERRAVRPSTPADGTARVGGWASVAFARLDPDTTIELMAHAFAYEHMEVATYELLARAATRAGDHAVVDAARTIEAQERRMADRLAAAFDIAVDASLRDKDPGEIRSELVTYLVHAHAIESHGLQVLEAAPRLARGEELAAVFGDHLRETREHRRLIEACLAAHDAQRSRLQSARLRLAGAGLVALLAGQPDTPLKLIGFAYAFEHLEIAAHELLSRIAARAGDADTQALAGRILADEHAAARRIAGSWDLVTREIEPI